MMETTGTEITKSPIRKRQPLAAAVVVISIFALIVGLTIGLKRKQHRKNLMIACKFLNIESDLKFCLENTNFGNRDDDTYPTIPSEIGLLTQMKSLKINGKFVFGTIPSSIGSLTKLEYLNIFDTQLTGTIPSEFGNMIQLVDLGVPRNSQLTGTIPPSLGNLTKLNSLRLTGSKFSGTIPSTLGALVKLTQLDLSSNQLTGSIPSTFVNLTELEYLGLQSNEKLVGTIPSWICPNQIYGINIDCGNFECSCCSSSIYIPESDTINNTIC